MSHHTLFHRTLKNIAGDADIAHWSDNNYTNRLFFNNDEETRIMFNNLERYAEDAYPAEIAQCLMGSLFIGWSMHKLYLEEIDKHDKHLNI